MPENTVASALRAVELGATRVEIDVQLSRDGVVHVMHDDTLDRTTTGSGCVAVASSADIALLTADGEPVPTLGAFLSATTMPLNVELKAREDLRCPDTDRSRLASEVAGLLDARDVIVSSFDLALLLEMRALSNVPLAFLGSKPTCVDVAIEHELEAVHPRYDRVDARMVDVAHAAGLKVHPWTVNDVAVMERLIALGVDGIITDYPERLVGLLS